MLTAVMSRFLRPLTKTEKIAFIAALVLLGTSFAVFYNFIVSGYYMARAWPTNSFFEAPQYVGNDFTRIRLIAEHFTPFTDLKKYMQEPMPYPPFALIWMALFGSIPVTLSAIAYYGLFLIPFIFLNVYFFHSKGGVSGFKDVFILTFFTYPFLYVMDRGNMDMHVFLMSAFGILAFYSGRVSVAGFLWVLASAMKFYPALFFVLFLKERRFRETLFAASSGVVVTLISVFLLRDDWRVTIQGLLHEMSSTKVFFLVPWHYRCLSLATHFRALLEYFSLKSYDLSNLGGVIFSYYALCLFVVGVVAFVVVKSRDVLRWEILSLLVPLMLLLPPMSHNYKLLMVLIPVYYFVAEEVSDRSDFVFMVLFSILLIPVNFFLGSETIVHLSALSLLFVGVFSRVLYRNYLSKWEWT
jgi:hypothetical protein